MTVSFRISSADRRLVEAILDRADGLALLIQERLEHSMDLIACHANGNRMDFAKLLAADDFNFMHDFCGIYRHMNRETGKLMGFFSPRCLARVAPRAEAA